MSDEPIEGLHEQIMHIEGLHLTYVDHVETAVIVHLEDPPEKVNWPGRVKVEVTLALDFGDDEADTDDFLEFLGHPLDELLNEDRLFTLVQYGRVEGDDPGKVVQFGKVGLYSEADGTMRVISAPIVLPW